MKGWPAPSLAPVVATLACRGLQVEGRMIGLSLIDNRRRNPEGPPPAPPASGRGEKLEGLFMNKKRVCIL